MGENKYHRRVSSKTINHTIASGIKQKATSRETKEMAIVPPEWPDKWGGDILTTPMGLEYLSIAISPKIALLQSALFKVALKLLRHGDYYERNHRPFHGAGVFCYDKSWKLKDPQYLGTRQCPQFEQARMHTFNRYSGHFYILLH